MFRSLRADAARHAEHELEVERPLDDALLGERERLLDVADLVALELGDGARRAEARGDVL